MALFKKRADPARFTRADAEPWVTNPAVIDPHLGVRAADDYVTALRAGDLGSARVTLMAATPTERRVMIGSGALRGDPPVGAAEQWVAQAPDDGVGHLVLGALLVLWAWEARGDGGATTVEGSAWDLFFDRLRRADTALHEAARLMPGAVEPWPWLITSGKGLQIPLEELTARFDEGHRREPFAPGLVGSMLQALCAKWSGSHEQMFTFARWVTAEVPAGSPAMDTIAEAHIEVTVERAGSMPILEARSNLCEPEVRQELLAAAERSIFHPDFVDDGPGVHAANTFLFVFSLSKDWVTTKRVLDVIQGRYTEFPLCYLGDAGTVARRTEVVTARQLMQMHRA